MLQPSHVYSPLQNCALGSENRAMWCFANGVFSFLFKKSQRSMARAVAVLQNLIWEFELDGPQKTVQ